MKPVRCGPALWWCAGFSNARETAQAARSVLVRWPDARVTCGANALWVQGPHHPTLLENALATPEGAPVVTPQQHTVDVVYDGEDLAFVARKCGLTPSQVVDLHAGTAYRVELLGFLPGFAYLTGLDPRLHLPRRETPRPVVPANSVAVAGPMTGIYPAASPGGWHLLGTAQGVSLFDPGRSPPCMFSPGDVVRMVPTAQRRSSPPSHTPTSTTQPALRVVSSLGWVTVQDGGRPHVLPSGIPASGPWSAHDLAYSNTLLAQDPTTAALEVWHGSVTLECLRPTRVASEKGGVLELRTGEILQHTAALDYLAVEGGVDVPLVMGSRATLVNAGLGGMRGRPLKKGDTLGLGRYRHEPGAVATSPQSAGALRVWRVPNTADLETTAWETLLRGPWRVSSTLSRVGVRLEGPGITRTGTDAALPGPMCLGAIQVSTQGTPIILGPDHPATGGYPLLAVVHPQDLGTLARLAPGEPVQFVAA